MVTGLSDRPLPEHLLSSDAVWIPPGSSRTWAHAGEEGQVWGGPGAEAQGRPNPGLSLSSMSWTEFALLEGPSCQYENGPALLFLGSLERDSLTESRSGSAWQ